LLKELMMKGDDVLALEVVRTLAARNAEDARSVLAEIAADESKAVQIRGEAIAGLSTSINPAHQAALVSLEKVAKDSALRDEAHRSLRFVDAAHGFSPEAGRPEFADIAAWLKRLDSLPGKADPEAGRRIFFHPKVALCAGCHRHSGRGNVVGPDLSFVARQGDREAILRSILEPQREVAPQFYPTQLKLKDGSDFMGILLRSSSTEVFRDLTGKERTFQKTDIVQRTELKTSIMPPGLVATMTDHELRDLLAFLTSGEAK
jgi:hypothetical protein